MVCFSLETKQKFQPCRQACSGTWKGCNGTRGADQKECVLQPQRSFLVQTADKAATFEIIYWATNWSSWRASTQLLLLPTEAAVITQGPEKACDDRGLKCPRKCSELTCHTLQLKRPRWQGLLVTGKAAEVFFCDELIARLANWRILLPAFLGPSSTLCFVTLSRTNLLYFPIGNWKALPDWTKRTLKLSLYAYRPFVRILKWNMP